MVTKLRWLSTVLAVASVLTGCDANSKLQQIEQGTEDVQRHSQAIQDEAQAK